MVPAALSAILLYACLLGLELPNLAPLWIAPRAEAALQRIWPDSNPLGTGLLAAGFAEPSLMFLAGTNVTLLPLGPVTADIMAEHPMDAALVAAPDVQPFLAEAARRHLTLRPVATIAGFHYSRGAETSLTLFVR